MASIAGRDRPSFLSTAVVSRTLGLSPDAVRAMIDIGSLPEPQWITFGSKVERIYSLEWLILASDRLNLSRLSGLEQSLGADELIQFAVRFDQNDWTVAEIAHKLVALNHLWELCARVLQPDDAEAPPLKVRRLSSGSPLDILASVDPAWAVVSTGVATLLIYLLRNPSKVGEAIPALLTGWRSKWAEADEAKIRQIEARAKRRQFEKTASSLLRKIDAVPSASAVAENASLPRGITAIGLDPERERKLNHARRIREISAGESQDDHGHSWS